MVREHTTSPGQYRIEQEQEPICSRVVFNEKSFEERSFSHEEIPTQKFPGKITWLNIENFRNSQLLDTLKEQFKLHSLTLEDIVRGGQRSKHECFENYDTIFLQVVSNTGNSIQRKQLSIIFNADTIITFGEECEKIQGIVSSIFTRIKEGKGRVRRKSIDYLAYCFADGVVDSYFSLLEEMESKVEETDDSMLKDPNPEILHIVHSLKKDMLTLKKSIWPLREMATSMQRGESKFIKEENFVFIRDLYDHTVRIVETTESLRDITYGLIDLYMSSTGMKMNQAMKVLTVISTIFVPITFLTSVYGMNFDGIEELHMPHAYGLMWLLMISVACGFLYWFKKKKWL